MKKIFFFLCICICLVACENNEEIGMQDKVKTVIKLTTEGISISDSPLTRTSADRRKVYCIKIQKITPSNAVEEYACGYYDDVTNVSLELERGNTYNYYVVMIDESRSDNSPFGHREITNSFLYKDDFGAELMQYDRLTQTMDISLMKGLTVCDMFYGESKNCQIGNSISIDIKRVGFGVEFDVVGLYDGEAVLSIGNTHEVIANTSKTNIMTYYRFNDYLAAYQSPESYSETYDINVVWKKTNGEIVLFDKQTIPFHRNKLKTITVTLPVDTTPVENNISITVENDQLLSDASLSYDDNNTNNNTYSFAGSNYPMPVAVDLGLPSGNKWASMNCGALSSFDGGRAMLYNEIPNIGDGWEIPTIEDYRELYDNCIWYEESNGFRIIAQNGSCMILPIHDSYWTSSAGVASEYGIGFSSTRTQGARIDLQYPELSNYNNSEFYYYSDYNKSTDRIHMRFVKK